MKIKKFGIIILGAAMLFLAACGSGKQGSFATGQYYNPAAGGGQNTRQPEAGEEAQGLTDLEAEETGGRGADNSEPVIGAELFLITENDMQAECLILEQLASGKQYMYNYSLITRFLDKYGNRTSVSGFMPGRVICVGKKDEKGRLLEAQISDAVWEYPGVTRFSVDEERGILQIADTKYSCDEDVFVHADGDVQKLSGLTDMDTLRVAGIGKKVLSISVVTGHGELELKNTDVFAGSYIQIGTKIFAEITGEMTMEIPEGTYTVAVANKGYGGSTDIEILRGEKTVLDLETLKGDGPKYGEILFAVDVAGAILQIDGKRVDYSGPVPVQYGAHTLTVTADSYEPYSKKLFVNSERATIAIGLSGDGMGASAAGDAANDAADNQQGTDAGAGDLAGSLAGKHGAAGSAGNTGGAGASQSGMDEAEINAIVDELLQKKGDAGQSDVDYLSTISKILSALSE